MSVVWFGVAGCAAYFGMKIFLETYFIKQAVPFLLIEFAIFICALARGVELWLR